MTYLAESATFKDRQQTFWRQISNTAGEAGLCACSPVEKRGGPRLGFTFTPHLVASIFGMVGQRSVTSHTRLTDIAAADLTLDSAAATENRGQRVPSLEARVQKKVEESRGADEVRLLEGIFTR